MDELEHGRADVRDRWCVAGRRQGGRDAAGRGVHRPDRAGRATRPSGPTSGRRCRRATCWARTRARRRTSTTPHWYSANDVELVLGVGRPRSTRPPTRSPSTTSSRCATTSCCWPPVRACASCDVPGAENIGVHYLRTLAQSDMLREALQRRRATWSSSGPAGSGWRSPRPRASTGRRDRGRGGHAAAAPGARRRGGDRSSPTCTGPTGSTSASPAGSRSSAGSVAGSPTWCSTTTSPNCRPTWSSSAWASGRTWSWPRRPGSRSTTAW